MEPYALFNFLQSILASSTPEKTEEPLSETPKTEKVEPEQPSPVQEQNTAFLQFMQAHETRAKRTKKP